MENPSKYNNKSIEEARHAATKLLLNDTEGFLVPLVEFGILSIKATKKMSVIFDYYMLLLNDEDRQKFHGMLTDKIKNLEWLSLAKENIHKGWLFLNVILNRLQEIIALSPDAILTRLTDAHMAFKLEFNNNIEQIESKNKDLVTTIKTLSSLIDKPKLNQAKSEVTLTWNKKHELIKDLFLDLIEIGCIHKDETSFENFFKAFTGVPMSDFKKSINWKKSVRLLVYLMDQLDTNSFFKEGRNWASIIHRTEIFHYQHKPIAATTLSTTKNQINSYNSISRQPVKGYENIDLIINKLRVKSKNNI